MAPSANPLEKCFGLLKPRIRRAQGFQIVARARNFPHVVTFV